MTAQHTPIPWTIDMRSSTHVLGAGGRHVCSTGGYATNTDNGEHHDENDANAEFIVRAVNSHALMLEALETAALTLDHAAELARNEGWPESEERFANDAKTIRAAIRAATGEDA